MSEKPSLKEFYRAFTGRWLNLMSGPATVPVALAALVVSAQWASILSVALAFLLLSWTAYNIWSAERWRVIDLGRVDCRDMERMLGGVFFDKNTFLYGGEINPCKRYKGVFEISRLSEGYDLVKVRAPHGSIALIKLQYMNGHLVSQDFGFYVMDGAGHQARIEDIYQTLRIRLNEKGEFSLKLVHGDSYEIHEHASLLIDQEGFVM